MVLSNKIGKLRRYDVNGADPQLLGKLPAIVFLFQF